MNYFIGSALLPHPPVMLPEIGAGELAKMSSTVNAVKKIVRKIMCEKPQTLVIISPHAPVFQNCAGISAAEELTGSMHEFGRPDLSLTYKIDLELAEQIAVLCEKHDFALKAVTKEFCADAHIPLEIDKGSFVPLYYMNKAGFTGKIVHLSMGLIPYKKMMLFGNIVKTAVETGKKRAFILASGDLSHRLSPNSPGGYSPSGKVFDRRVMSALPALDSSALLAMERHFIEDAGECGLRPIYFLMGAMQDTNSSPQFISYEGPFGVGYGTGLFICGEKHSSPRTAEALLARNSLLHYLRTGDKLLPPEPLPPAFSTRAGVFVSLKKFGSLRGCIGTILPSQDNMALEIINNAVCAGTEDPRFLPVTLEEINDIDFSVDILNPPEPAEKVDLDPQKYGVIVTAADGRRGLLLPMLEGIDTAGEQISAALQKAAIQPHEPFTLYRFTVSRR